MVRTRKVPKPAFMALHDDDVHQVRLLLKRDWGEYLQRPEVVARVEEFRSSKRRFFDLHQGSLSLLVRQWVSGVPRLHSDCSIVPEEELLRWQYNDKLVSKSGTWHIEHEDEMSDEEREHRNVMGLPGRKRYRSYKLPFKKLDGRYISDRFRCGSIVCRPGDPFGCALGKRRMHMDRIAMMLFDWRAHGTAQVCRFEVVGHPDEPLVDVLTVEQNAFTGMVAGGAWISDKKRGALQGYVCTLSVSRYPEERRWVVRRWLICVRTVLPGEDVSWEQRMLDRWARAVAKQGKNPHHVLRFVNVQNDELAGLAQLVTGTVSELDVPKLGYERIAGKFLAPRREQSVMDLWRDGNDDWDELVRALDGDKMLLVSKSGSDHPAWKASTKRARETFGHPDWRRPERPRLSFDGLPATPTPYDVISPGAARRRRTKPGDRVYVLKAGRSWNAASRDRWNAGQEAGLEQYLRAIGVIKGVKI